MISISPRPHRARTVGLSWLLLLLRPTNADFGRGRNGVLITLERRILISTTKYLIPLSEVAFTEDPHPSSLRCIAYSIRLQRNGSVAPSPLSPFKSSFRKSLFRCLSVRLSLYLSVSRAPRLFPFSAAPYGFRTIEESSSPPVTGLADCGCVVSVARNNIVWNGK